MIVGQLKKILPRKLYSKFQKLLALSFIGIVLDLGGLLLLYAMALVIIDPITIDSIPFIKDLVSTDFSNEQRILILVLAIFLVFLFKNILSYMLKLSEVKLAYGISDELARIKYSNILKRDLLFHKSVSSNDIINQLTAITTQFADQIILSSALMISELLFLGITTIALALFKIRLLVFLLITLLPPTLFLVYFNRKKLRSYGETINVEIPEMYRQIKEGVLAYTEIQLHMAQSYFQKAFTKSRSEINRGKMKLYMLSATAPHKIMEVVAVAGILLLAIYAYRSNHLAALASMLALFTAVAFRMLPSINRVINSYHTINSFQHLYSFIENEEISSEQTEMVQFNRQVELQNVSFKYNSSDPLLESIDLQIPHGTCIGIKGASGSGKTTLLHIILGLIFPQSGTVKVDDVAIKPENAQGWYKNLAYVRQDAYLFEGSILSNIALGIEKGKEDKKLLEQVLEQSALTAWINELTNGLDTQLSEIGRNISGGQRQRIALARALYKEADLYIFDEATNALDQETKSVILKSIADLKREQKTIVIVSHDNTALSICDKIFTIDNASIHT